MDTPSVVERLRAVVQPAVAKAGLVVEDVEVARAGAHSVVRVLVSLDEDDEGPLDLDRLGAATSLVSGALDVADVLPGAYTLEVSSPGVDRLLTARRHYVRALGRRVHLRLVDGGVLAGRLDDVEPAGAQGAVLVVVPRSDPGKGRRAKDLAAVRVDLTQVRDGRVEVDLTGLRPEHDDDAEPEDGLVPDDGSVPEDGLVPDDEGVAGSSATGRE